MFIATVRLVRGITGASIHLGRKINLVALGILNARRRPSVGSRSSQICLLLGSYATL